MNGGVVIAKQSFRRSVNLAVLWGLVVSAYNYGSAVGYLDIGTTPEARARFTDSITSNPGIKALLGKSYGIHSVADFAAWRSIGILSLIMAIWALLTVTRLTRGEEDAGRWDLLLSGRTNRGKATLAAALGILASFAVMGVIAWIGTTLVGRVPRIHWSAWQSAQFALAVFSAAVMFGGIALLLSQIFPTRGRAAGAAAIIVVASLLIRAAGDIADGPTWIANLSPLGWLNALRVMTDFQPQWLIPVWLVAIGCGAAAVKLASRRDTGDALLTPAANATSNLRFLGNVWQFQFRMLRGTVMMWLAIIVFVAVFYGSLAVSAGNALANSDFANSIVGRLAGTTLHTQGTLQFVSVIAMIIMVVFMAVPTVLMAGVRSDESQGYVDNLLVRQARRISWFTARMLAPVIVLGVGGVLAGAALWLGVRAGGGSLPLPDMLIAGINATMPAWLLLGIVSMAFAFVPRITAVVGYVGLGWSFLLTMLGAGLKLPNWIMNTSLIHHISLAPLVAPTWRTNAVYLMLSGICICVSMWRFAHRDIALAD